MHRVFLTSGTVFLSGALLLTLELLVARALLPKVGGSALAWTTCVAFFQVLLLAGAFYAHVTASLGARRQALLHAGVVLAALAMLPLGINGPAISLNDNTIFYMLHVLTTSVGLPCFVLCTTSSLVLQWLFIVPGQNAGRAYAASNAGSLSGLIAYPFLIEPALGLSAQTWAWTVGFGVLCGALGLLMLIVVRAEAVPGTELSAPCPPSAGTARQWFILAFVPCSLLLGVTSHMTNELPSFPLLWVVPLALYLVSLVLAFATSPNRWMSACLSVEPVLIAILVILMFVPVKTSGFLLHLAAIFVASLTLHGRLALLEPEADRGAFVLWTCAGGAAAGIFNAVVAPQLFPLVVEFQLAVVAACLLRPMLPVRRPQRWAAAKDLIYPVVLAVCLLAVLAVIPHMGEERDILARTAILFVGAGVAVIFRRRPVRYGLGMAAVLVSGFWTFQWDKTELLARSAYGVSRVVQDRRGKQTVLFHGTTIHGAQGISGATTRAPRFYFRSDGPLGSMLSTAHAQRGGRFFAVVGLGAGSLAWYVQPSQQMRFYEIDPVVEKIARQPRWFTYLTAAKGEVDVKLGDGRLALAAEIDNLFDVIILDAFSSDSAPTHLLTREAFEIYLQKLKPHGLLVFNTSNRHIDLSSVVVAAAQSLGLHVRVTLPPAAGVPDRQSLSEFGTWAVVARDVNDFAGWLSNDDRWVIPKPSAMKAWTDDRTGMLSVLKW
jgi:hypothetical protein